MKITLEQHEFDVLKAMIRERLSKLENTINESNHTLDEYEKDIRNYTTYDIHRKLMEAKTNAN